ncbi:cation:proton antiporter domain-containing protein [Nocardioides renjunii]|uniref:cation:proton antiporter domain-containing protein n=1 Tax=Nocardioides renjunii TaxID=3095075 RepID=UPI002AFF3F51|nr:cation:proton antiporter [Nocardioides sp. S-34]WQQ20363.1 cation:proton antiporter [Nocardioides sp. S-34]
MTDTVLAALALLTIVWAVTSSRLADWDVTGALVFLTAGFALANPTWGPIRLDVESPSVHRLAELTLAMLLFADASRVDVSRLRRDVGVPARLLGIGLPLSIVTGSVLAAWIFADATWALALFVGAALAPTDAALSAQVVGDERVPGRVRRVLNVESGLNDGIATPVVVFALAVVAADLAPGVHGESAEGRALLDLAVGLGVGLVVGLAAALLVGLGAARRWIAPGGRRLATLGAALGSFSLAVALDGNGFIAAFVAGAAFGAVLPRRPAEGDEAHEADEADEVEEAVVLPELLGQLAGLAVWFLFGAALLPVALDHLSVAAVGYAVLSLTAVRMVPVAVATLGAGLDRSTVLFIGWFGPRGLASVVFALLAVEELGESAVTGEAVAVIALTVTLSVVLHGVSAGPLGARYRRTHQITHRG